MRDWDRNGKIDARDRYIFHEVIMKDDTTNYDNEPATYSNRKNREMPEISWGSIAKVWGVVAVLLFITSLLGA